MCLRALPRWNWNLPMVSCRVCAKSWCTRKSKATTRSSLPWGTRTNTATATPKERWELAARRVLLHDPRCDLNKGDGAILDTSFGQLDHYLWGELNNTSSLSLVSAGQGFNQTARLWPHSFSPLTSLTPRSCPVHPAEAARRNQLALTIQIHLMDHLRSSSNLRRFKNHLSWTSWI